MRVYVSGSRMHLDTRTCEAHLASAAVMTDGIKGFWGWGGSLPEHALQLGDGRRSLEHSFTTTYLTST
jgi:hypothetical protein